jgi:AraC-like DNA-binding protein
MAAISQQVGFCDQSYFGTVFRRIVGMTPATYRGRIRTNTLVDQRQPYHMPPLTRAIRRYWCLRKTIRISPRHMRVRFFAK